MKTRVLLFFTVALFAVNTQVSAQKSTTVLLKEAQIEAKKDGKSIFIKFEASWCGWCHKMTKDMKAESTKKIFSSNFVTVPVVVMESPKNKKLENHGSTELLKKYGGDKAGLPFWIILDRNLKVITNSFNSNGQNLGGPASPEEVNEFIAKIKMAIPKLSKADADLITAQFVQKK